MTGFLKAMHEAGISPPTDLYDDGKIHRFHIDGDKKGSKNGWYVLHADPNAGAFGTWKQSEVTHKWSEKNYSSLTSAEKDRYHANMEKAKQLREEELIKVQARCQKRADFIWKRSRLAPADHPYLVKKNVEAFELRLWKGALVVPVRKTNPLLVGLQFINADSKKRFLTATDKKGAYHLIGGYPDDILYLAEGYATAATVHHVTGKPVAVCFDCGNLKPVAHSILAKFANIQIVICADNDRYSDGNPGVTNAIDAAQAVDGLLTAPEFPEGDIVGSDFNDLATTAGFEEVRRQILAAKAPPKNKTEPLPLRRSLPEAEEFPIDALPLVLRDMTKKIIEVVQAPSAMVAQSVLIGSALAAQSQVDVSMMDGRTFPVSLFAVSIGESGERKSAIDNIILAPHGAYQRALNDRAQEQEFEYQIDLETWKKSKDQIVKSKEGDIKSALLALGPQPMSPINGQITTEEPTYEGLVKLLQFGQPSVGIFSSEGGRFVGGYAMAKENQLKTAAGLSKLWDGSPIDRIRGEGGNLLLYGRRCSIHLMLQPGIADKLLASQTLSDQGLLSRCLVCYPASTIGNRPYKILNLNDTIESKQYFKTITELLEYPKSVHERDRNELNPRKLFLSADARAEWIRFHDHVESLCKEGKAFATIRGFACKVAEQAARIAGTIAVVNDIEAKIITVPDIQSGIEIAQFYLGEALRLFHSSSDDPELVLADKCLSWAVDQGGTFSLPCLYQRGPNRVRDKKTAQRIIEILEQHNWILPATGSVVIDGKRRREVWKVAA